MSVYSKSLKERFEFLKAVKVAEKDLERIIASVALSDEDFAAYEQSDGYLLPKRTQNTMMDIRNTIESGVGQDMGERGTAMWVYNGLTSYYQNVAEYRNDEVKFNALMGGRVQQKVFKAVEMMV